MKKNVLFAVVVLALSSLACQTVLGGDKETPLPPPPPLSTPAPTDPANAVLPGSTAAPPSDNGGSQPVGEPRTLAFSDDFTDPNSGWDIAEWENGATRYTDRAQYEISVYSPNYDIWANPGLYFENARVEVDFLKVKGPKADDIGLICRYSESDKGFSFYYMVVGSDGFAAAYRVLEGDVTTLQELDPGSVTLSPPNQVTNLKMDCLGNQLRLFVNDQLVMSVTDNVLKGGDVGLIAGVYDEPGLVVRFNSFRVYTP